MTKDGRSARASRDFRGAKPSIFMEVVAGAEALG
jgi:hypothetical protein